MNKYQNKWDACLVRGWLEEAKMFEIVKWFFEQVDDNYLDKNHCFKGRKSTSFKDVDATVLWLVESGLDRCTDKERNGRLRFHSLKQPVRAFIDLRSTQLSNALWGGADIFMVLKNISAYKWVSYKTKSTSSAYRRRLKLNYARTRVVHARALDKNHDWDTVK